jgi:GT2 family glycosyltransferase
MEQIVQLKNNFTILIPTYQRPLSLKRCLISIHDLKVKPSQIVVVCRNIDFESIKICQEYSTDLKLVKESGTAAAIFAGLSIVTNDLIGILDDDVELPSDWSSKCLNWFSNSTEICAVGGRDSIPSRVQIQNKKTVGKFQFFGRMIGNHSLGTGKARQVDFLKGCNFMMKKDYLTRMNGIFFQLKGSGAQVGNDLILTITPRLKGKCTIYDPQINVTHYEEERILSSPRDNLNSHEWADRVYNLTLIKLTFCPRMTKLLVIFYAISVGDTDSPGLLKIILKKGKTRTKFTEINLILTCVVAALQISNKFRDPLKLIRWTRISKINLSDRKF